MEFATGGGGGVDAEFGGAGGGVAGFLNEVANEGFRWITLATGTTAYAGVAAAAIAPAPIAQASRRSRAASKFGKAFIESFLFSGVVPMG